MKKNSTEEDWEARSNCLMVYETEIDCNLGESSEREEEEEEEDK